MQISSKFKTKIVILLSAFVGIYCGLGYAEEEYEAFPVVFNLTDLNGRNGFAINGIRMNDHSSKVSRAGDVNGDGIDDILIGASGANNNRGQSYIIFGSKEVWPADFELITLNGKNGFAINGINFSDNSGFSLNGVGDVNGDGIDDILIGAFRAAQVGQSYVVFGSNSFWPAEIDLDDLNGRNGFAITGINVGDDSGWSVSRAGDVNGDGIDDILIGAPNGNDRSGQIYLVFGSKGRWPSVFYLKDLNGLNGFVINGIKLGDFAGFTVSGAGDVNGDDIADILIGAPWANNARGQSYVVFGSKKIWPAVFLLEALNGENGFAINAINAGSQSGWDVSRAGDVNGDRIDDILIDNRHDRTYVIFGNKKKWDAVFNLGDLNGNNGFVINVIKPSSDGITVSGAGDVNGDGIDDILIGDSSVNNRMGQSYIVFGNKVWTANFQLTTLNGNNGFVINGIKELDFSGFPVSRAGDVNNDGIDDFLIGAWNADNGVGHSYLIFGERE